MAPSYPNTGRHAPRRTQAIRHPVRRGLAAALMLTSLALATVASGSTAVPAAADPATGSMPAAHATGASTGLITMTEGGLEMRMTRLSGQQPTWTEIEQVYQRLAPYQAMVSRYHDPAAALRDGYTTAPFLNVDGQGAHYIKRRTSDANLRGSGTPGTMAPPVLVYDSIHGKQTLAGLMFVVPANTTPQQMAALFPASMASWHQHINSCVAGDMSKVLPIHTQSACSKAGGFFVARTGWMVHAWMGPVRNTGLFALDMRAGAGSGSAMQNMPGM